MEVGIYHVFAVMAIIIALPVQMSAYKVHNGFSMIHKEVGGELDVNALVEMFISPVENRGRGKKPSEEKKDKRTSEDNLLNRNVRRRRLSVKCLSNGRSGSLTQSALQRILNTGLDSRHRMFEQGGATQDTYLTVNFGHKVYIQENANNHAEDRLFSDESVAQNTITTNGIWLNNSPCPRCAQTIMNRYSNGNKPTIFIQNVYVGQGLDSTLDSLMCLAKMIKKGFNIVPWDWNSFKGHLDNEQCKRDIESALNNDAFQRKRALVVKALSFLRAVQNTNMANWCT